jgi:hypothetical protein
LYRPTLAIDAIGLDDLDAIPLAMENMSDVLMALVSINRRYIRRYPDQIPLLYNSGVRYDRMEPEAGSACGDDDWADVIIILEQQDKKADCFPVGTLLLRDDYELVPIEQIRVGDRIWGRDAWTTVEATVYKGLLSVDGVELNNGSIVQLTGDHHFFVGRCDEHPNLDAKHGYGCSCRLASRRIERIRLRDLRENDVVVTPERIAFGAGEPDVDRAYVEGLFVADGWVTKNTEFSISGQDGCPKERQKLEVKAICDRLGIETRWHRKSIAVKDADWALRVQQMGHLARNKQVLSLDLGEAAAAATIRGLMADSNVNSGGNANGGWTFSSSSRVLTTQMRVLLKMFGRSAHARCYSVEEHRGLGQHPIWRLGVREPREKSEKLLRVKEVERDVAEVPCYDIQTSDHYVYLPEHDATVSNCEDLSCWRVAELNEHFKVPAVPFIRLYADRVRDVLAGTLQPRHLYHIMVRWPEGLGSYPNTVYRCPETGALLEDPSRILGME